jgi:hypothetical protein
MKLGRGAGFRDFLRLPFGQGESPATDGLFPLHFRIF